MDRSILDPPATVTSVDQAAELMAEINREFEAEEQCIRTSAKRRCKIGGMLLRIKEKVGHGNFKDYIDKHFKGSYRSARRLMQQAKELHEKPVDSMVVDDLEHALQNGHCGHFDDATDEEVNVSGIPLEREPGDESENGCSSPHFASTPATDVTHQQGHGGPYLTPAEASYWLKEIQEHLDTLIAMLDQLAQANNLNGHPKLEEFRRKLAELLSACKALVKKFTKEQKR
jgi:hypothetical protein